jgi:hypothetical protein
MHKELTLCVYFSISFVVTVWLFVVYQTDPLPEGSRAYGDPSE